MENTELFCYSDYVDASDIQHHGIKGQKWGIRRFQNKDGSLTSKGKSRYSSNEVNGKQFRKGYLQNNSERVNDSSLPKGSVFLRSSRYDSPPQHSFRVLSYNDKDKNLYNDGDHGLQYTHELKSVKDIKIAGCESTLKFLMDADSRVANSKINEKTISKYSKYGLESGDNLQTASEKMKYANTKDKDDFLRSALKDVPNLSITTNTDRNTKVVEMAKKNGYDAVLNISDTHTVNDTGNFPIVSANKDAFITTSVAKRGSREFDSLVDDKPSNRDTIGEANAILTKALSNVKEQNFQQWASDTSNIASINAGRAVMDHSNMVNQNFNNFTSNFNMDSMQFINNVAIQNSNMGMSTALYQTHMF